MITAGSDGLLGLAFAKSWQIKTSNSLSLYCNRFNALLKMETLLEKFRASAFQSLSLKFLWSFCQGPNQGGTNQMIYCSLCRSNI